MPATNKFNVSSPEPTPESPVQSDIAVPPETGQNIVGLPNNPTPRRSGAADASRTTNDVSDIRMLPSNIGEIKTLFPFHIFTPNYKIACVNFDDGQLVGVVMGAETVMVRGSSTLGLYLRTISMSNNTLSMSYSNLRQIMSRYRESMKLIAVISEDDVAPVVGLRIFKDSRLDTKVHSIVFSIGPRTTPERLVV